MVFLRGVCLKNTQHMLSRSLDMFPWKDLLIQQVCIHIYIHANRKYGAKYKHILYIHIYIHDICIHMPAQENVYTMNHRRKFRSLTSDNIGS